MKKQFYTMLIILVLTVIVVFGLVFVNKKVNDYPLLYNEEIKILSEEFNVPQEIIFSVIRAESSFRSDAVSSAGAVGLMQLMPKTFNEIAQRLKEEIGDINDPYTNIRYGTFYLAYLHRIYEEWDTVFAAYNAGMGRVNGWLSDSRYSDDAKTLHTIPIKETENYVIKVKTGVNKYKLKLEK
ncbi:lytic transglycosylase domain-containing protein [Eubacteriales bacterium OttesenSCG-928-G02]|nr:lytic transglycosylase domain-containing protein [Eubacteriales bacterium OttesenSCG-928-G02]